MVVEEVLVRREVETRNPSVKMLLEKIWYYGRALVEGTLCVALEIYPKGFLENISREKSQWEFWCLKEHLQKFCQLGDSRKQSLKNDLW